MTLFQAINAYKASQYALRAWKQAKRAKWLTEGRKPADIEKELRTHSNGGLIMFIVRFLLNSVGSNRAGKN